MKTLLCLLFPFLCLATELTLEEKVGQLLMVHFHGMHANHEAEKLILEAKVGGIIYYTWANGLESPEQVRLLSHELQALTQKNRLPIPLFIAVDQEGGPVRRLLHGFTPAPSNQELGQTGNLELAESIAYQVGQELKDTGINVNLAPVVDIGHTILGARTYGTTAEKVAAFGKQALRGYRRAGILPTLKHFPGHGEANADSHATLPIIQKSFAELQQQELFPFTSLANETDFIMTAHLLVPALDGDHCTTLSKKSLDYLKNEIGFKGIILTDSLVMEGVLKQCGSVEEAAIQAINAGCDLLLLGGKLLNSQNSSELSVHDVLYLHQALVQAVHAGRIPKSRIDEAAAKIISLKSLSRI